jgi:SAM-dependent methyltransferase
MDLTVDTHYTRPGLGESILAALRASGKSLEGLGPEDLAPVDHFHLRGKPGTMELARRAGITAGTRVLDVGGGIGGPARTLASELGCSVTVLDLTEDFCRVGEELTRLVGLGDRVTFRHGSALETPYPDGSYDLAWTEHSSMNIEDKERLYAEVRRVLRPGGRLAMYEIMAGPVQPIHFPVPWASAPEISFLRPPQEVRALIAATGFRELDWADVSGECLEWLRERMAAAQSGPPPPLGVHLILGEQAAAMFRNVARGLEEDRLRVVQAVFERL